MNKHLPCDKLWFINILTQVMALLNGAHSTNVSTVIKELANLTKPGNEIKLNANELSTSLDVLVQLVAYNAKENNSVINTTDDQRNIVQIGSNLLEEENSNTWLLLQEVVYLEFCIRAVFNIVCSKTKTKVIPIANHRQSRGETLNYKIAQDGC